MARPDLEGLIRRWHQEEPKPDRLDAKYELMLAALDKLEKTIVEVRCEIEAARRPAQDHDDECKGQTG